MTVGARLREERERLGFNQEACAALASVTRKTVFGYESDARPPDALALGAWAKHGLDVLYVITGQRQGRGIGESAIHQAVLDAVDLLSLEKKVDAVQLAKAVTKLAMRTTASSAASGANHTTQNFHAPITGGVAGRDIINKK